MDRRISLLRALACLMVVVLHIATNLLDTFDRNWMAGNVYDSMVRTCVPLFIMISGATLLAKREPLGVYFRKRALRIIPPLLFWSLFYLAWKSYCGNPVDNWPLAILKGPTMYHLWYFYALVGMYLFIPVLRVFLAGSSRSEQLLYIWLWVTVCAIIPSVQHLLDFGFQLGPKLEETDPVRNFDLSYYSGLAGYLVLGAFAMQSKLSARNGWAMFAAGSALTIVGRTACAIYGKPIDTFAENYSPTVMMAGYGLFVACMSMRRGTASKLLTTIGECTLGIYGLHVFVAQACIRIGFTPSVANPWFMIPVMSATVFLITFGMVYLLRLFRPLRYVI